LINPKACDAARRNGWFDKCTKHMIRGWEKTNFLTFEMCFEDASKYSTRYDWRKNNNKAYNAASKHGWLKKCTERMPKRTNIKN